MKSSLFRGSLAILALGLAFGPKPVAAAWVDPAWIHPKCKKLDVQVPGPFVVLADGNLLAVHGGGARVSRDDGRTWSAPRKIPGSKPGTPRPGQLVRTREGTIILAYHDGDTYKRVWDKKKRQYSPDSRQDIWTIRSQDEGKTWTDRQRIFEGYGAIFINMMQAEGGNVVLPLQGLLVDRTHHAMCSYVSQDQGKTWTRSNVIDLGGHGNHEGAFEGTVGQLSDGRLWMLIRTNLDQFWSAYSSDGGLAWRVIEPSGIDASSAPGYLLRLASGRLVLVWNRLYPEGKTSYPRRRDGHSTSIATSWHRDELSIAFSDDDGRTWTKPVVIARDTDHHGMAYPFVLERRPGEIWVTTRYPSEPRVRVSLQEADFVGK